MDNGHSMFSFVGIVDADGQFDNDSILIQENEEHNCGNTLSTFHFVRTSIH